MAKQKRLNWADYLEKFAEHQADDERSVLTIRNYRDDLASFAKWYESKYEEPPNIGELAALELREWTQHIAETRGRKGTDGKPQAAKPASTNRKLAAIGSFLKWAQTEGFARPIKLPKMKRQTTAAPKWLTVKEEHRLMRAVEKTENPRDIAIATIGLHVGLRVSELVALQWADITISERKGTLVVQLGKGRKRRTVPLNLEARNALTELGYARHERKKEPVFVGQRGPMTLRGVQSVVEGFRAAAKLPELSCHVLRHTFCKRLAESGARLETIAALAGHESIETTRRYVEPGEADLQAAVERRAANASSD